MKATLTTVTRTSHWLWESHAYYLVAPTIPGAIHSFISRPTVQRATAMPSRFSCFQTFGTP